jgi:transcription elongation factor GreA
VSTTDEARAVWLTQEAYDRLKAELEELIAHRPVIAAEINARREEGDLKENGGYHAAKDEQGKQEGRIRQLQELLRQAKVGDAPTTVTEVGPGTVITVQFDDDPSDTDRFLLGSREIGAGAGLTVYSPESALGAAIMGRKKGESATYTTPAGGQIKVTIVELAPFTG